MTIPQVQPDSSEAIRIDGRLLAHLVDRLCEISEDGEDRVGYFRQTFEAICQHFDAVSGVINVRQSARTMERNFLAEAASADWIKVADALVLRTQTEEVAISKGFTDAHGDHVAFALAAPFMSSKGNAFGGIALVIKQQSPRETEAILAQLVQLMELIVEIAPRGKRQQPAGSSASQTLKSVIKATDYHSIQHLSFAIVNGLCERMGLEQVTLGLTRQRDIRLLAISGMEEIPGNTPGIKALQQALAVGLDRGDVTVVQKPNQVPDQLESSTCRVHQFWHQMAAGSSVASIPLFVENSCIAVIGLRKSGPFVQDDIERARVLAQSFAPALPLVDRASWSLVHHLTDSMRQTMATVFSWKKLGFKLTLILLAVFLTWVAFGKKEYQVLASCKIVPEHTNIVSAPFEGKIARVLVRPGQQVEKGQPLVEMDTRDLKLELRRVLTSIASTKIEKDAFLRERKSNEAFLKLSQIAVLETDLVRIRQQLKRAKVCAVEAGVVLPSELHRKVGQFVTLGESMLEIAENRNWQLEINSAESDARHIVKGQLAQFQTHARPDQPYACEVLNVHPAARVADQKNVVVVEARLLERDSWMKVGMEGSVRINTAPQPIWWIYAHPVIDYLRLKLWL